MKYLFYIFISAALLTACQMDSGSAASDSLENLIQKKDSLTDIISSTGEKLRLIEAKIAEQDTTKKPPLVNSLTVTTSTFKHFFKVQGNVESENSATLFPETQGLVKAVYVKEGQKVSRGQKLLSIDNDIIANQIAEVENQLTLATDVYERQERLWNQNIGSELQYLEAKNRKTSLEKSIATLRKQQSMATLTAPFSGEVDQVFPKVGEMASPGMPAVSIVNLNQLYTAADISEKYLAKVKKNTPVVVSFGEGLDTIAGKISNIGKSINPANRTFEIKVDFMSKSEFLRPNLMTEIQVNDFTAENAVVIPNKYILEDINGNPFVYLVAESSDGITAKKSIVNKGLSHKGMTMILEGLKAEDKIITDGARKLTDGSDIRLTAE